MNSVSSIFIVVHLSVSVLVSYSVSLLSWHGGIMVKALDSHLIACRFSSRLPFHPHVATLGRLFTRVCVCFHCYWPMGGLVAEWLGRWTCDQLVAGSNPGLPAAECNPGQVVNTHVPLSPSSIIWYQPMGGDALKLGRPGVSDISGFHLRAQGLGEGDEHPPMLC